MRKVEYKSPVTIMKIVNTLNLRDCGDSWDSEILKRLGNDNFPVRFVVAKQDDAFIGWCARFSDDETHVYVRKDFRRKGIGSKLLAHVIKKEIFCEVIPWCDEAHSFFKSNEHLGLRFAY